MTNDLQERLTQMVSNSVNILFPVDQGLSGCSKFKVEMDNRYWMAKIFHSTSNRVLWYKELGKLQGGKLAVPEVVRFSADGVLCLLTPWIDGTGLEDALQEVGNTGIEIKSYAVQAANLIKELHRKKFPMTADDCKKRLMHRIDCACKEAERLKLAFPHVLESIQFLRKAGLERACDDMCFVHMDIRPENFILQNGQLYLIDFDNGGLGESVSDFVYLTTMGPGTHHSFTYYLLNSYWGESIPSEFWEGNLVYSTLQMVEYAIWKYNNRGKQVLHQANNIWNQYDGFTSSVPLWWRDWN